MILLWFGSIGSIPAGYALCDGNNGTPDLRDNFVVGAGSTYAVDATGGAVSHSHSLIVNAPNPITSGVLQDIDDETDAQSNLPPYHALAYIMKT